MTLANNNASGHGLAKGLGGGVFVLHSTTNDNGNNQGMPVTLATVTACGVSFQGNGATSQDGNADDTNDFFDPGFRINPNSNNLMTQECPIFKHGFE